MAQSGSDRGPTNNPSMTDRSTLTRTSCPAFARVCARALLVATPLLGLPRPALAQQDASAAEVQAARSLFLEGLKLAESGRCADAIERFERAERLHHAITITARLGECQVELGKIVQGTETLLRVVRERLPPDAPRAFVNAQTRAQKVLDAALPKVAKLKISLKGAPESGATITLDGEAMPAAFLDAQRPTDPGTHLVEATASGFLKESARVTLTEGGSHDLVLTLRPDPNAPKAPPPQAAKATQGSAGASVASPGEGEAKGPNRLPAFIAFGVGAAGLAAGTVFGLNALHNRSHLNKTCPERGECPEDSRDDIDAMSRSATFSTISFGVGLVGVGAGVALLIFANKPAPAASARAPAPRVLPFAGPGSLGLTGTF
jgi:hypothetical protein